MSESGHGRALPPGVATRHCDVAAHPVNPDCAAVTTDTTATARGFGRSDRGVSLQVETETETQAVATFTLSALGPILADALTPMSKPLSAAKLGALLLDGLRACKAGSGPYPPTIRELLDRLDPAPDEAAALKAAGAKAFTSKAVAVVKGRADSPVALVEDGDRLAELPFALEAALLAKQAKGSPPWSPKQLATALPPPLRDRFQAFLAEQIAESRLPPFAMSVRKGKSELIYHRDRPPTPPPPEPLSVKKETVVARKLIDQLRLQRDRALEYPLTLRTLAEKADVPTDEKPLKAALKQPEFLKHVDLATWKAPLDSLASLAEDRVAFSKSEALLKFLLTACEQGGSKGHAFTIEALTGAIDDPKPKVKNPLKPAVAAHLEQCEALDRQLPASIAYLDIEMGAGKAKAVRRYFILRDRVKVGRAARPERAASAPYFDASAARGPHGGVRGGVRRGLHPARPRIGLAQFRQPGAASASPLPTCPRVEFDARLQDLRRARRYWLKSAEGYGGLTQGERDAAVEEEGELLLYVSRVTT